MLVEIFERLEEACSAGPGAMPGDDLIGQLDAVHGALRGGLDKAAQLDEIASSDSGLDLRHAQLESRYSAARKAAGSRPDDHGAQMDLLFAYVRTAERLSEALVLAHVDDEPTVDEVRRKQALRLERSLALRHALADFRLAMWKSHSYTDNESRLRYTAAALATLLGSDARRWLPRTRSRDPPGTPATDPHGTPGRQQQPAQPRPSTRTCSARRRSCARSTIARSSARTTWSVSPICPRSSRRCRRRNSSAPWDSSTDSRRPSTAASTKAGRSGATEYAALMAEPGFHRAQVGINARRNAPPPE